MLMLLYNNSYDLSFVLDDLSLVPSMLYDNNIHINDLIYCMGIPSVKSFNIDMSRTYIDINSNTMLLEKNGLNNNSIISKINETKSLTSINKNNIINVLLEQDLINETGLYQFNDISNILENSGYFNNLTYQQSILTTDYSLNWIEKVENLYTKLSTPSIDINYDISLNTNHYCDKNSFDSNLSTCNLNLNNMDIYEVTDISALFKTPISDLCYNTLFEKYDDHTKKVKEHTLLYINNKFQNVNTQPYPNISDFSYNNLTNDISKNLYDSSNQQYDFNGDLSDNGFKWIAIKLEKYYNSNVTPTEYGYKFNNILYKIIDLSLNIQNILNDINIIYNFYDYNNEITDYDNKLLFFTSLGGNTTFLTNLFPFKQQPAPWHSINSSGYSNDLRLITIKDILLWTQEVEDKFSSKYLDSYISAAMAGDKKHLLKFPPATSFFNIMDDSFFILIGVKK